MFLLTFSYHVKKNYLDSSNLVFSLLKVHAILGIKSFKSVLVVRMYVAKPTVIHLSPG